MLSGVNITTGYTGIPCTRYVQRQHTNKGISVLSTLQCWKSYRNLRYIDISDFAIPGTRYILVITCFALHPLASPCLLCWLGTKTYQISERYRKFFVINSIGIVSNSIPVSTTDIRYPTLNMAHTCRRSLHCIIALGLLRFVRPML